MSPQQIVKKILNTNRYLTMATTDGKNPWANVVFFAVDNDYNLYFVSYNNSVHVKNILKNPNIAVTIFDSRQKPSTNGQPSKTQGIQINGKCRRLTNRDELETAIKTFYLKRFPDEDERKRHDISSEHFMNNKGRTDHIYKIIPEHFYILDKKVGKDTRMEIFMI